MPIAKFQLPDGRVGRFEVPEGTSPEQAMQLISTNLSSLLPKPPPEERPSLGGAMGETLPEDIQSVAVPKKRSVLEGMNLGAPPVDYEMNRQAMLNSVSPESVMYEPGRQREAIEQTIAMGKAKQEAKRNALRQKAEEENYTPLTTAQDIGASLGKGVIGGVAEPLVGIWDLMSFGSAGRALEELGYQPQKVNSFFDGMKSATSRNQEQNIADAEGFVGTIKALGVNPVGLVNSIAESVPGIVATGFGGGKIARTVIDRFAKEAAAKGLVRSEAENFIRNSTIATLSASAAEGIQSAGSVAEAGRQSGQGFGTYAPAAIGAGVTTAAISGIVNKFAAAHGVGDLQTHIAAKVAGLAGSGVGQGLKGTGFLKELLKEGTKEGVFEEMPQSATEQIFNNIATGKPWDEGVDKAAAQGLVLGASMAGIHVGASRSSEEAAKLYQKSEFGKNRLVAKAIQQDVDQRNFNPAAIDQAARMALSPDNAQMRMPPRPRVEQPPAEVSAEIPQAVAPEVAPPVEQAKIEPTPQIAPQIEEPTEENAPSQDQEEMLAELGLAPKQVEHVPPQSTKVLQTPPVPKLPPKVEKIDSFPMGENSDYHVLKTPTGYVANLFDNDAGKYVSGSTRIFSNATFGNEAQAKATAYAKEESKKATKLNPPVEEVAPVKKKAAKEPVDTSTVKDLMPDKLKTKMGYVIYKRTSDNGEYWYVQSARNKLANRIGSDDSAHSDLANATSKIEQNIMDEEFEKKQPKAKVVEPKPATRPVAEPIPAVETPEEEPDTRYSHIKTDDGQYTLQEIHDAWDDSVPHEFGTIVKVSDFLKKYPEKMLQSALDSGLVSINDAGSIFLGYRPEDIAKYKKSNAGETVQEKLANQLELDKRYQESKKNKPLTPQQKNKKFRELQAQLRNPNLTEEEEAALQKEVDELNKPEPKATPTKGYNSENDPLYKAWSKTHEKVNDAITQSNKYHKIYNDNKTPENLKKFYEAQKEMYEAQLVSNEASRKNDEHQHAIGYLTNKQFETVTANNKDNIESYKKTLAGLDAELNEQLAKLEKTVEKTEPAVEPNEPSSESVNDQLDKFSKGEFDLPSNVSGTGEEGRKIAKETNALNAKAYDIAAKLFLEGPLTTKPPAKKQKTITVEHVKDIDPQPVTKTLGKPVSDFDGTRQALLAYIAPKADIRYYLNGTHINEKDNEIVATDGHRMASVKIKPTNLPPKVNPDVTVLNQKGEWMPDATNYPDYKRVTPTQHGEKVTVNLAAAGDYARGVVKAGKYIGKTDLVNLPITIGDKTLAFNANYVADMTNLFRKLGYEKADISFASPKGMQELIYATSPDGKVTQVIMPTKLPLDTFKPLLLGGPEKKAAPKPEVRKPEPKAPKVEAAKDPEQALKIYEKQKRAYEDGELNEKEFLAARKTYNNALEAFEKNIDSQLENSEDFDVIDGTDLIRVVGHEKQLLLVADAATKLTQAEEGVLETEYGAKVGTDAFLERLHTDVIDFITYGAKAIKNKLRPIIQKISNSLLSVAMVFNPNFVTKPEIIAVPKYETRIETVYAEVPVEVKDKMSPAAQQIYKVVYPTLKEKLIKDNKFFIVTDKPMARTFIFNPDGSLLLDRKVLLSKSLGDFLPAGSNEIDANKITPAGLYDLGLRDATRSKGEAKTAGEYDYGKVFVIEHAGEGRNGPYSMTIMHSVWTHEKDAAQRLAALKTEAPNVSRYSFGCINVDKATFGDLVKNHLSQMDGAKLFIVPDSATNAMDFVNGKATYREDIMRQRVEPLTKEVKVPVQTAKNAKGENVVGREERFENIIKRRNPELTIAAQLMQAGMMTKEDYNEQVNFYKPIYKFKEPALPASEEKMVDALDVKKRERVRPNIPNGTKVGLRLDIPAFNRKGVYVVTIHTKGAPAGPGKVLGYNSVAKVKNVTFGLGRQEEALDIAAGKGKDALQTVEGEYVKMTPEQAYAEAQEVFNSPLWSQIGIDPERHSYFYERESTNPVIGADEVLQIGSMLLAKNVRYGRKEDYLYDIGTIDTALEEKQKRNPSMKRRIKQANKERLDGRIDDNRFISEVDLAIREDQENKYTRPIKRRVRGADFIKEKLNWAVRHGHLTRESRDLAEFFINQNEALVDDLGISIKARTPGVGGFYTNISRIMTLMKEAGNDQTTVHEILHHTERMMPEDIQNGIRKEWIKQLLKAQKSAKTPEEKVFFAAIMNSNFDDNRVLSIVIKDKNGNVDNTANKFLFDTVLKASVPGQRISSSGLAKFLLQNTDLPVENYQFVNPSEFWAVNGSNIVAGDYDAIQGGVLSRLKNWLGKLAEKLKSMFGFTSDAPIIRALESLRKSDGVFKSQEMLGIGEYENIKYNYKGAPAPAATFDSPTDTKMDVILRHIQDRHIDTKRLIQELEKDGKKIGEEWNPYRKEELYHGRTADQIKMFLDQELVPLVKEMGKNKVTIKDFDEYLYMRHAEERNEQVASINPTFEDVDLTPGSGKSTSEAQDYLKNLSADKRKVFESLAARVDAIIMNTQDVLIEGGLETADTIHDWNKTYAFYVPLQRSEEELDFVHHGSGLGQGMSTKGGASKRATGSSKTVVDIFSNIALQRERAIIRSEKAVVGKALYGLALQNPNPNFWLAVNPDAIKNKKKLFEELTALGLSPAVAANIIQEPKVATIDPKTGLVRYQVNPALRNSENVFPVRINGKDRYVFFNNQDVRAKNIVKAMKNLDSEQLGYVFGMAGDMTRWIAAVNTQYNPVFGAWNFARDSFGATFNLSTTPIADKKWQVNKNIFPALFAISTDLRKKRKGTKGNEEMQKWFQSFLSAGGATGYSEQFSRGRSKVDGERLETVVEKELSKLNRGNVSKVSHYVFDLLSDYNDAMENAVRLSAFKVYLENNMSKAEVNSLINGGNISPSMQRHIDIGASIAKNLTVNFNRKGAASPTYQSLFAFFNASVQGTARLAETLQGPAGKKIIAGGIGLGVFQALILAMAGYDDDEPPEYLKNKNFIIPLGDTYLIAPLPLGLNILPGIGRIATEYTLGKMGFITGAKGGASKVLDIISLAVDTFNPLGGGSLYQMITPTIADPIIALATNKDAFGRPISKQDLESRPSPGYTRSRENANVIAQGMAEFLNYASGGNEDVKGALSPTADQIAYFAGQYTGGVGRELMKGVDFGTSLFTGEDLPSYRVPIVGKMYGETNSPSAIQDKFYKNIVIMSEHEDSLKGRMKRHEDRQEYMEENPEAKLWKMANAVENQVSALNKQRKMLIERGAPDERIEKNRERKTQVMERFNEKVKELQAD